MNSEVLDVLKRYSKKMYILKTKSEVKNLRQPPLVWNPNQKS